ncbi:MAG: hypothetical protein ACI976_000531 [Aureispira sp.]|jgi:hypothetical protein
MKTIFFMLLCTFFMFTNSSYATDIDFNVQIWKNTVSPGNYLGYFSGSTNNGSPYAIAANNLGSICPGDKLIIKNYTAKYASAHSFTGTGSFGKATIGLSGTTGYNVPHHPFADVCDGGCNPGPVEHFPDWNWGTTITVTVPAHGSLTSFLVISTSIPGNRTFPYGCGPRWLHIPMSLAPTTAIDNQVICPDDIVNLSLDPSFTYSNWIPSNPDGTTLDLTQNYTVDITHTATGCTQTKSFTISVTQPDVDPFADNETLCFDDPGFVLTEDWFINLSGANTYSLKLIIDGNLIADEDADIMNFPHTINSTNYPPVFGSRIITVEYTYINWATNTICTKTYTITIHPEIHTDIEDSYAICDGNFTSICAHNLAVLIGATYQWTKVGDFFVHSTSPCYTPSSYGEYCLTITDAFGCKKKECFTVYDPGVGINAPSDIIFCSLFESPVRTIGWHTDPFNGDPATYIWTYTNDDGITTSITNIAPYYQVPNIGTGTYTVVVTAGGCTETFTISVIDLLQIYENHSNAAFSFTPLGSNNVACTPTLPMGGMVEEWMVVDEFGYTIPTTPYGTGIQFSYTTSVEYTITFKRTSGMQWCQVFTNQFTWLDNSTIANGGNGTNGANNRSNESSTGITTTVPATIQAFPNPTSGLVNLKLINFTTAKTSVQVINTLGAIVLQQEVQDVSNIELDLSKQSSGIYIIRVINGDNELTQKVVKE